VSRPGVFAAVDLGAESGRVVCGRLDGDRMELEEAHRFPNRPVRLPDGLRWNLLSLFSAALDGLRSAAEDSDLRSVGVDAWGVDYALLDAGDRVLGLPFHYRDERTVGMVERAYARVPRDELYRTTGIQTMPINTVFQLLAEEGGESLAAASRIALVPDLIASWLCGVVANEATAASTTGLLDARTGRWAGGLIERLGLPARIFGELVEPGAIVGSVLPHHRLGDVPVCAVAAHDTASAFVAAPLADRTSAVLSSGTWSLLGLELDEPVLDEDAQAFNLSNERGVDGTTRLLRNVMGLWLLQSAAARSSPRAPASTRTCCAWPRRRATTCRSSIPTTTTCCAPATCRSGSPRRAYAPDSDRRHRRASSCAASSSRSHASTGSCSSASSRSPGGASRRST